MFPVRLPAVSVTPEPVALMGGLDLISPSGYAKAGTCRFAQNYELEFGGGYRRLGGIERFSGQPAPSEADYVLVEAAGGFSGVTLGATVVGQTTGTEARMFYISPDGRRLGLTRIVGTPFVQEALTVGASLIGTITDDQPGVDGFLDNVLAEGAANDRRADIGRPPGSGPVRGVAVLNSIVYCWRDVGAALVTYKQGATGWVQVPYYSQVQFTEGTVAWADGSALTQGASTATIKRVMLERGSWDAGTAEGRLIVQPGAGVFAAGAAAGGGAATLLSAAAPIQMLAGGRVQCVPYNFTASLLTTRLYGCDGVNAEWEFDGDVLAPIATGMAPVRARHVACHKNHLFYLYNGSLQHSGTGLPFQWSPVVGAGELGTGDIATNLISASGSEAAAALMVMCQDSIWVLYGSSDQDWQFTRISEQAGAQPYSAQEMISPIAFDRDGFTRYRATQAFGNFSYDSASRMIEPLVKNVGVKASVLVKNKSKYRCFFDDGLFVTGTPADKGIDWMACSYGRVIECAVGGEINGRYRVFYGDADGWVLEADVGRSFDGEEVEAYLRLSSQNQRSSVVLKQYRHVEFETQAESAFALAVGAEFSDSDPDVAGVTAEGLQQFKKQYGTGLFWDFESWDRAYWDGSLVGRPRFAIHGQGRSASLLVRSLQSNELPHTLKSDTLLYTPRRLAR